MLRDLFSNYLSVNNRVAITSRFMVDELQWSNHAGLALAVSFGSSSSVV